MTPIALNHPDLKQAAQELEQRVGDYTRMRIFQLYRGGHFYS
jgi:hypothetical protein